MTDYIGGDRLTFAERKRRYEHKLKPLPVEGSGNWRNQCFCGFIGAVKYRGRWYCPRCGRRLPRAPHSDRS